MSMGALSFALNRVGIGKICPSIADGESRGVLLSERVWPVVGKCSLISFVWSLIMN